MISLQPSAESTWILKLRQDLKMSQVEFGQLFGVHFMTVSRWERGILVPTPYQWALMDQFRKKVDVDKSAAAEKAKQLLVGAGVVAALVWLLNQ